jgi:hypothetical protein
MTRDELRAEWMRKLRSGEHAQCTGQLCTREKDGSSSYCCLGVAKLVAEEAGVWPKIDRLESEYDVLRHLFGLRGTYGNITNDGVSGHISGTLVGLNDNQKKTFPEIADVLESGVAWAD